MSINAQNTTPTTSAEQTSVMADAQETERIAPMATPQQSSIFPQQANPGMPSDQPMAHPMSQTAAGAPGGPIPPRTAMPASAPGAPAAPIAIRERLSNKMIGLVVGVSLACGLAAGVTGTAITNAISNPAR